MGIQVANTPIVPTPLPYSYKLDPSPKPLPVKFITGQVLRQVNDSVVECTGYCLEAKQKLLAELNEIQQDIDRENVMISQENQVVEAKQATKRCAGTGKILTMETKRLENELEAAKNQELEQHKMALEKQEIIRNQAKMLKNLYDKGTQLEATLGRMADANTEENLVIKSLNEVKRSLNTIKKNIRPPPKVAFQVVANNSNYVVNTPVSAMQQMGLNVAPSAMTIDAPMEIDASTPISKDGIMSTASSGQPGIMQIEQPIPISTTKPTLVDAE